MKPAEYRSAVKAIRRAVAVHDWELVACLASNLCDAMLESRMQGTANRPVPFTEER